METTKTSILKLNAETENMVSDNTLLIKVAIGLFALVLNISCIQLFFL